MATFEEVNNQVLSLSTLKNVDFFVVGYSLLGKPIYGAHIGNYTGNQILIEGAIHAREWVTTPLLVDMVKYLQNTPINGGMFFVPMVNPDGVKLVLDGAVGLPCEKLREFLINVNEGSEDFSLWKADANAVDLNVNFDALWGGGSQNVFCPAPGNFVGYYPNSEREVRDLIAFTLKNQPKGTLSFHTKGEVIYYGFETLTPAQTERDLNIANQLSQINGYEVIKTENSTGGYSDWVSQNLQVPAFTIEVGNPLIPHPIGEEYLPQIFEKNKDIPLKFLDIINELNASTNVQKHTRPNLFNMFFKK